MPAWMINSKVDSITTAMFALAFAEAHLAEVVVGDFGIDDLPNVSGVPGFWPSEFFSGRKPADHERAKSVFEELPVYRGMRIASCLSPNSDVEKVIANWSTMFRVVSIQPNHLVNPSSLWLLPNGSDAFIEFSCQLIKQPPYGIALFGKSKHSALKEWQKDFPEIPIWEFKPQTGVHLSLQSGLGIPYTSSVYRAAKGIAA